MIKTANAEVIEYGVLAESPRMPDPMCLHGAVVIGSGDSESEAFESAWDQLHNSLSGKAELQPFLEGHFTFHNKVRVAASEQGWSDGCEQVYIAIRTTND